MQKNSEEMKKVSHWLKEQVINFTQSSKRKLQAIRLKNKFNSTSEGMNEHSSRLRVINRLTTTISGVVVVGLSVGLLYMAQPIVTAETFEGTMEDSISAAFNYKGNNINIKNETLSYHIPRQFKYKWSIGVNDVIKYKDNEVIMNYNHQYSAIDVNNETYDLLREENRAAGHEVFYKSFNRDGKNGFVQLVQLPEKYLLMVLVDGTKLSAIIDYQEAPYLTYNMLVLGRTAVADEVGVAKELQVSKNEAKLEDAEAKVRSVDPNVEGQGNEAQDAKAPVISKEDTQATEMSESVDSSNQQMATEEGNQVIQFDFSTEKRQETEGNKE